MSLNIKNPRTVALVRELADRTGLTQTSAIEEAVAASLARLDARDGSPQAEARLSAAQALLDELDATLTDEHRATLRAAEHDLFDDEGLPR